MMKSSEHKPILRWPLDIRRVVVDRTDCMIIRDPLGVATSAAYIPLPLMPILGRFDGSRSIADIVREGAPYGVTMQIVLDLIEDLDSFDLIENERTLAKLQGIKDDYSRSNIRPASLAGLVYPDNEDGLNALLSKFKRESICDVRLENRESVQAIMCPHIDYNRGWQSYAKCAQVIEQLEKPDIIIFFGTAHQSSKNRYSLSRKIHACPLGDFHPATEALDHLNLLLGGNSFYDDEFIHRSEHSIELQLPIVAHSFGGKNLPKIIPILVGSFHDCLLNKQSPGAVSDINEFVGALGGLLRWLKSSGQKVLIYSGVDLSHVGQHFGDQVRTDKTRLNEVAQMDMELLDLSFSAKPEELIAQVTKSNDKNRVCGYSSLFTMLSAMEQAGISAKGKLIDYRQAVDNESDCVVSFASAYWSAN